MEFLLSDGLTHASSGVIGTGRTLLIARSDTVPDYSSAHTGEEQNYFLKIFFIFCSNNSTVKGLTI